MMTQINIYKLLRFLTLLLLMISIEPGKSMNVRYNKGWNLMELTIKDKDVHCAYHKPC